jgi:hypothetical protein
MKTLTVSQLIEELKKQPQDAEVVLQITEPYDDEAETLEGWIWKIVPDENGRIVLVGGY